MASSNNASHRRVPNGAPDRHPISPADASERLDPKLCNRQDFEHFMKSVVVPPEVLEVRLAEHAEQQARRNTILDTQKKDF